MKYTNYKSLPGPDQAAELLRRAKEIYDASCVLGQIKYNGMHVVIKSGQAMSRDDHKWAPDCQPKILAPLVDLTRVYDDLTIHLELYSDTIPFAEYMGLANVKRVTYEPRVDSDGQMRIFDVLRAEQPWATYESRLHWIKTFGYPVADVKRLATPDEINELYEYAISQKLEGAIYRIPPCLYLQGPRPIYTAIYKRKGLQEVEGTCVAIKGGTGKRKGMLGSLIVQLPNGRAISVGGGEGLTDAYLTKLYRHPPIGLPVTITFEDQTDEGMPLRPQLKGIRNYE